MTGKFFPKFETNSWNHLANSSDLKLCKEKMREILKVNGSSYCGTQIFNSVEKNTCGCIRKINNQGLGLIRALKSKFIEMNIIQGKYCFF